MSKKKAGPPRPRHPAVVKVAKPVLAADLMSPAAGVRALRRSIEARRATGNAHQQRALDGVTAVLARLETVYGEAATRQPPSRAAARLPHVAFMPAPIVNAMLKLAGVTKRDVVYDLGCGDGRIVVAAAKRHGAKGVGIDDNPERLEEARKRAARGAVTRSVRFVEGDLFTANIRPASVVTISSLPSVTQALRSRLLSQLAPGTRIVSCGLDMGDWQADKSTYVGGRPIHCWIVPRRR